MARRMRLGGSTTRSSARLGSATQRSASAFARPADSQRTVRTDESQRVNWSRVMAAMLVIGSLGLIYQLFAGQRFATRHVVAQGNVLLTQQDIEQATGLIGKSIFHVNPDLVADALKEQYGCLAQVKVHTRLPNEVIIETREFRNLVIWQSGGGIWWVTRDGRCLGPAHHQGNLPIVQDLYGHNTSPHDYIVGVPWDLLQDLLETQPQSSGFDYTREHGMITYVGQERWPAFLGHLGDARLKLAIMSSLYDHLIASGQSAEYIDLRNEREPTFKPR